MKSEGHTLELGLIKSVYCSESNTDQNWPCRDIEIDVSSAERYLCVELGANLSVMYVTWKLITNLSWTLT